MKLLTVRNAIVNTLKVKVPDFKFIETFGGSYNQVELKRIQMLTPSALVALLGIPSVIFEGLSVQVVCNWSVFVTSRNQPQKPRDAVAIDIVDKVLKFLPFEDWGLADIETPKSIRVINLYTSQLDQDGAAIYQISWNQTVSLDTKDDPDDIPPFLIFAPDYYLPGDEVVDAQDEVEIPQ